MKAQARNVIALLLIVSTIGTALPPPALAGMIGTDSFTAVEVRDRIASTLQRAEVARQLGAMGVRAADLQARVDALTDEEAAEIAARLDSLPAGGDGIIGAVLLVFLILLITDIVGLTKVFPFTRPIK